MYSIYLYNIKRIAGSEAALNSRYIYLVTEFVNYLFDSISFLYKLLYTN